MAGLQRPAARTKATPGTPAASDEAFAKKYPTLAAYLTDTAYEDGSARRTATMTVFAEEGLFKASINDREQSRSAFMAADTFTGLLDRLEKGLQADRLDWRTWTKGPGKK